jgi:hypothetical protein
VSKQPVQARQRRGSAGSPPQRLATRMEVRAVILPAAETAFIPAADRATPAVDRRNSRRVPDRGSDRTIS